MSDYNENSQHKQNDLGQPNTLGAIAPADTEPKSVNFNFNFNNENSADTHIYNVDSISGMTGLVVHGPPVPAHHKGGFRFAQFDCGTVRVSEVVGGKETLIAVLWSERMKNYNTGIPSQIGKAREDVYSEGTFNLPFDLPVLVIDGTLSPTYNDEKIGSESFAYWMEHTPAFSSIWNSPNRERKGSFSTILTDQTLEGSDYDFLQYYYEIDDLSGTGKGHLFFAEEKNGKGMVKEFVGHDIPNSDVLLPGDRKYLFTRFDATSGNPIDEAMMLSVLSGYPTSNQYSLKGQIIEFKP